MRLHPGKAAVRLGAVLAAAAVLTAVLCINSGSAGGGGSGGSPSSEPARAARSVPAHTVMPEAAMEARTPDPSAPFLPAYSAAADGGGLPIPVPGKAVIAFTFDDGYVSDYDLAYPILKKYGIRGTSYIIGKFPDSSTPDTLSWAQIKEMAAWGWCFGCHTYNHMDMTTLSDDAIRQSLEEENQAFLRQGMPSPQIIAYPSGKYDSRVIDVVRQYRLQGRKAFYESKFVDLTDVDPYQIDSISADMQEDLRLKSREALVDKACEQGAVIVFRTHCMYREQKNDEGKWDVQTDSRLFAQLVQYCVDKNCAFVTMEQLMRMYTK